MEAGGTQIMALAVDGGIFAVLVAIFYKLGKTGASVEALMMRVVKVEETLADIFRRLRDGGI